MALQFRFSAPTIDGVCRATVAPFRASPHELFHPAMATALARCHPERSRFAGVAKSPP
jgi:hypothetical protein